MPKAIPDGYHALTPYISCRDAAKAIEFYKHALGAKEIYRMPMPSGKIGHAELEIGDSMLMLADESPQWGNKSAKTLDGCPTGLVFYTEDVEAVADEFIRAGGRVVRARSSFSLTATDPGSSKTPKATSGPSHNTSKTYPRKS
jgi:PhnB protein